jgi:hypothetical protein
MENQTSFSAWNTYVELVRKTPRDRCILSAVGPLLVEADRDQERQTFEAGSRLAKLTAVRL